MTIKFQQMLTAIVVMGGALMSCNSTSSPLPATRCYVVQGDKARYLEVNRLAHDLAKRELLNVLSADASAVEITATDEDGIIALSSPFGSHVSIISLHGSQDGGKRLDSVLDELLIEITDIGMNILQCDLVPGLENPIIYQGNRSGGN